MQSRFVGVFLRRVPFPRVGATGGAVPRPVSAAPVRRWHHRRGWQRHFRCRHGAQVRATDQISRRAQIEVRINIRNSPHDVLTHHWNWSLLLSERRRSLRATFSLICAFCSYCFVDQGRNESKTVQVINASRKWQASWDWDSPLGYGNSNNLGETV